jgi:arylsulfatase A-like enzyme
MKFMFFFALLAACTFAVEAELKQNQPNILFIAVDDLRPELGSYGHPMVKSPNMDALAAGGLLFENAYSQTAVCMPSRVSVLSGYRPESIGFSGKFSGNVAKKATSLPQLFKNEGYTTVSIGKIYHTNTDDPEGWTRRHKDTFTEGGMIDGYSSGYQLKSNLDILENIFEKRPANLANDRPRPNSCERSDTPDEAHPDGIIALRAIEELRAFKRSGEPFFLATGFYRPHLPFTPPLKYWNLYDRDDIKLSPNNSPVQDGLTQYEWNELRRYGDIPVKGPVSDEKAKELIHGYYASVSFTDAQIGKVLAELKRLELDKNTVVILWGDHGWQLGDHGWWCKHTSHEVSNRTSMMISIPGKTNGTKTHALVELVDIYPSLCELANIDPPAYLEGRSFVPLIENPNSVWKEAAFSEIKGVRGMRTERYRLLRHKDGEFELFDHEMDPGENINVAAHPEYAHVLKTLAEQMLIGPTAELHNVSGTPDYVGVEQELKRQLYEVQGELGDSIKPAPLNISAMVQPLVNDGVYRVEGYSVWGPQVTKGQDGKYYLVHSRWPKTGKWFTHSEIALAVSDTPEGPYTHHSVLLTGRGEGYWDEAVAHNPKIKYFDGKYYLYYISGRKQTELTWYRVTQKIGVAVADKITGPYIRVDEPALSPSPPLYNLAVNPGITRMADSARWRVASPNRNASRVWPSPIHPSGHSKYCRNPRSRISIPRMHRCGTTIKGRSTLRYFTPTNTSV